MVVVTVQGAPLVGNFVPWRSPYDVQSIESHEDYTSG